MEAISRRPHHPPCLECRELTGAEAPARDEPGPSTKRVAAPPWAMADQLPGEVPSARDETAQRLNVQREKSSFNYARGRGICSTRKATAGFEPCLPTCPCEDDGLRAIPGKWLFSLWCIYPIVSYSVTSTAQSERHDTVFNDKVLFFPPLSNIKEGRRRYTRVFGLLGKLGHNVYVNSSTGLNIHESQQKGRQMFTTTELTAMANFSISTIPQLFFRIFLPTSPQTPNSSPKLIPILFVQLDLPMPKNQERLPLISGHSERL